MSKCLSGLARSPAMIRGVTNLVLMISDLDIIFSILFAVQVFGLDGIWKLGLIVHAAGVLTYLVGALYFGPKQKFQVINMVKDMMNKCPNQFTSRTGSAVQTTVKVDSRLAPNASRPGRTFGELTMDDQGLDQFKRGMAAWDLIHIWNFCEIKNAKNCTELQHSMPFLRLARFGFVAEPTPKDLGCILNANALYTFCTGIFQLVYGTIIMAVQGKVTLEVMLPLCISGVSFLLSLANVAMDFSGMLTAIEGERCLKEQVLQDSENERVAQKRHAEQTRDSELVLLESQFRGRLGAADIAEKSSRKEEVMNSYKMNVADNERHNLSLLEMELVNYRSRLDCIKAVERGRSAQLQNVQRASSMQEYENSMAPLRAVKERINQVARDKLNALDPDVLSGDDYRRQAEDIQRERMTKLGVIDEQLKTERLRFTEGQSRVPAGDAAVYSRTTDGFASPEPHFTGVLPPGSVAHADIAPEVDGHTCRKN